MSSTLFLIMDTFAFHVFFFSTASKQNTNAFHSIYFISMATGYQTHRRSHVIESVRSSSNQLSLRICKPYSKKYSSVRFSLYAINLTTAIFCSPEGSGIVRSQDSVTQDQDRQLITAAPDPAVPMMKADEQEIIIDVRSLEDFAKLHVKNSTSIPFDAFEKRAFELPPVDYKNLAVVGDDQNVVDDIAKWLQGKGWTVKSKYIVDREESWNKFQTDSGYHSAPAFRPNEFLRSCIEYGIRNELIPSYGVALDIGCGSGRDLCYMASTLSDLWTVIGLDNHSYALDRAMELAKRYHYRIETRCIDLRKPHAMEEYRAHIVHGSRFLDRNLLLILRDQVLVKGGLFIWSTFMEGEKNLAPPFKTSRRLVPGELRELFGPPEYHIIQDFEGLMYTRGVYNPASFFAAIKL